MSASLFIAVVICGCGFEPDPERTFAEETLLSELWNGNTLASIYADRFTFSPTLSVLQGNQNDQAAVTEIVGDINALINDSGVHISVVNPEDTTADVKVFFAPRQEWSDIFAANDGSQRVLDVQSPYDPAIFSGVSDPTTGMEKALVIVTPGIMYRGLLREMICRAMGVSGLSWSEPQSLFYALRPPYGLDSGFSDIDRKAIRLLYTHLWPGDGPIEVRRAYYKYWGTILESSQSPTSQPSGVNF